MPRPTEPAAPTGTVDVVVGDRTVLTLTPSGHRVRVGLAVPPSGRLVDVSVQPSTACRVLTESARHGAVSPEAVDATARRAIVTAARRCGGWTPTDTLDLTCAFGGVAFPLLGAAYDAGATAVGELPRWAVPVLGARTFGDGARSAFGAAATRPVRRALVDAVRPLPSGHVPLGVLALALMGRDALQPDRLARVLATERVQHPGDDLPDPATLRVAQRVLATWGDVRCERILTDAAARPDGVRLVLDTVRYAAELGDHGPPPPLPNRLDRLHDVHRALVPSATDPPPPPLPAAPPPVSTVPLPVPPVPAPPHRLFAPPPAAATRVTPGSRVVVPHTMRPVDGFVAEDLTLVLPRTVADLTRWGRLLSNCLGDFGPAAAEGRSVVVGVERRQGLRYAVELTPDGRIRQFCGPGNRAPAERDRRLVVAALLAAGALDPQAPANRPWMADVRTVRSAR